MKILYVHHGNRKLGNPPTQNDDLTEIGYKDCELVAELLNNKTVKDNIKAIYTSDFFRCKKTAEIINKYLNVPIMEDSRLNEFKSIENEQWVDLQNRVSMCIDDIIQKYNNDDIVVCVTSGINIVSFINKAYNLQSSNDAPFLGIPSCCPIIFDYKK
ncbi:MAG: histidine phosphatase family protein [Clostridia bacterium]|nr:histidine phosphatase family protein [Clostridia bacterium]